jgi:hypothetical protein
MTLIPLLGRDASRRIRPIVLALALLAPPAAVATVVPGQARAQSALFCPGTTVVIVSYQGETFTGIAKCTSGWGIDATHEFSARSGDGDMIIGVAKLSMIECVVAGDDGLVPMHDVQINGYASGGGTNV